MLLGQIVRAVVKAALILVGDVFAEVDKLIHLYLEEFGVVLARYPGSRDCKQKKSDGE